MITLVVLTIFFSNVVFSIENKILLSEGVTGYGDLNKASTKKKVQPKAKQTYKKDK